MTNVLSRPVPDFPPPRLLPVLRPHHFGISVPDLDAAIAWYDRVLGFVPEKQETIEQIPARAAFLQRDAYRIELFEIPGASPLPAGRREPDRDLHTHGNKHMCFEVPNVPAAVAALRAEGVEIAMVDGNRMAYIRDLNGNLVELVEPFAVDRQSC
ncbi:VOC family protein [Burkholderia gladioli]|jgi:methylmalonyl-CoA/ethylmalonyl-CoA epimerase|uniref:VOC family protein n=1 Tax=Burkholderia gladioli TaxID=28095 RepID=UPI0016420C64|nr:VOC family protein [Burkholderia gladioli]MBU9641160.1 VOC family protein [Burkholderia gladioli]